MISALWLKMKRDISTLEPTKPRQRRSEAKRLYQHVALVSNLPAEREEVRNQEEWEARS